MLFSRSIFIVILQKMLNSTQHSCQGSVLLNVFQHLLYTNAVPSGSNLSNKEHHTGISRPFIFCLVVLHLRYGLPVFSSARSPFKFLSKANWLNSRFSVKDVLRQDVTTSSWILLFLLLKQEQALEHLIIYPLFTNLSTCIIPFWKIEKTWTLDTNKNFTSLLV